MKTIFMNAFTRLHVDKNKNDILANVDLLRWRLPNWHMHIYLDVHLVKCFPNFAIQTYFIRVCEVFSVLET